MKIAFLMAMAVGVLACSSLAERSVEPPAGTNAAARYDIRRYGAVGDGRARDTAAIQATIDAVANAGGGTVEVPAGTYVTGSLMLRDNVTLHLEAGATLQASTDIQDFTSHRGLIHAEAVSHIAVTGRGVIDGQGGRARESTADTPEETLQRARARGKVLHFVRCRNIRVQGVTLRNSPNWMQHYFECEDVVIDGITVFNHCNHYNDGLNIDNCRDVRVSNCRISSGDDAIVLKSRSERFCENVTITNCVVSSHSNGIKLGTESHGGFRHISVSNCVVVPVDASIPPRNGAARGLGGITLATVDGAWLEQVTISNVAIRGTIAPIFLRLGNRGRKLRPDMDAPPIGKLRDVVIRDIVASGASSVGCAITGLPGHPIENLTLSNISMDFGMPTDFVNYDNVEPGGSLDDVRRAVPEKPRAYPECIMFGKLPAYGLYVRHVDGLTLDNLRLRWTVADQRPALFCHDVQNLSVEGLRARSAKDAAPVIVLQDVRSALIRGCMAGPDTQTFLGVEGDTRDIGLVGNHLNDCKRVVELGPDVPPTAVSVAANSPGP